MIPYDPGRKCHGRHFHFYDAIEALKQVKGKVLDVGCGPGFITHAVKKNRPDLEIFACDKDKKGLAIFEKRYGDLGVKLFQEDACQLSFGDQEFEAVLMMDILEHLVYPQRAVFEAVRVLRKKGVFYLTVPLEGELTTIDGWLKLVGINLKKRPIGHIQQFRLGEIREMLLESGLKITQIRFSHHFFYQFFSLGYFLYLALFRKGQYWSLVSEEKSLNQLVLQLEVLGGWLTYWESILLRRVKGQTLHISAQKL